MTTEVKVMVTDNRNELRQVRRNAYLNGEITHQTYYMEIAREMGLARLQRIVSYVESDLVKLKAYIDADEHLNNIPLVRWDNCHASVIECLQGTGTRPWSLSDSVCVLKAVARDMVEAK